MRALQRDFPTEVFRSLFRLLSHGVQSICIVSFGCRASYPVCRLCATEGTLFHHPPSLRLCLVFEQVICWQRRDLLDRSFLPWDVLIATIVSAYEKRMLPY